MANEKNKKSVKSKSKNEAEVNNTAMNTTVTESVSEKPKTIKPKGIKIKVRTLVIAVAIALILGLMYWKKGEFIVATVNGQPISRLEVLSQLEKQYAGQVLQNIITQEMVKQEAQKLGVTVSDEEVQAELDKIDQDFIAQGSSLEEALTLQGLKLEDVKEGFSTQLLIQKIVGANVAEVTDDETKTFIEANELGEATPELIAQTKDQLQQQKVYQESQLWLQQIRDSANINYYLYPAPNVTQ